MNLLHVMLIFTGGGLGSLARFGVSQSVASSPNAFPFSTLLANMGSSFILGILLGLNFRIHQPAAYLFLATGFCGGFSTYSTFTAETWQLMQSGNMVLAFANVAGNLLACLAVLFLGIKIGMSC